MKYLPLWLTAAFLWGCGAHPDIGQGADQAAIRALQAELGRAFEKREFDAVSRCYADDAVLLAPGRRPIKGKTAILEELRESFSDPDVTVQVRTERVEVSDGGDLAYSWGTGLTTGGVHGRVPPETSQWLTVYRKRDGAWKIAVDAVNAGAEPTL